ncbi:hypothetical protein [Streptomyces sp. GbtcB6]|uniref:hypothetical protein n=1 Tax=Streptomyces sp. GbtcB6 TaxID=2824751 RepID=UPI001C30F2E6|nr:hypothetical protein [Streptomyces sp. GbtcB6]
MSTDNEAIKAGTKEAITEWLETTAGRDAITAGARSAVVDWIELTSQGGAAISWGAERAITDWVKNHEPALLRALTEATARLGKR